MKFRPFLVFVAAVTLVATSCMPPVTPPVDPPTPGNPEFTTTEVTTGLNRPWDLAFTPDGTMIVTEKGGRILVVDGQTTTVIADPTDAVQASEGGMLGLAVDPDFATNRRIYTCFLSNISGSLDERVVRWTVDPTYSSVSERTDIVTGIPLNNAGQAGRHSGCRLTFGTDGALWITTGDAVRSDVPQNPASLGGKVLRVTTSGEGAAGNPGAPLDSRIYTLGHRNPQGIDFRPSDDRPFVIEHGTGCDDEVNVLSAGDNFGWNPGANGFYNESAPMTDTASVPNAKAAAWSSGCPTIAPSGGTFISGSQWGVWDNALVMAVLKFSQLRVLKFSDGPDATVTDEWTALTNQGRLRTAVQGPNGDLYVVTDATSILRLTPTPAQ